MRWCPISSEASPRGEGPRMLRHDAKARKAQSSHFGRTLSRRERGSPLPPGPATHSTSSRFSTTSAVVICNFPNCNTFALPDTHTRAHTGTHGARTQILPTTHSHLDDGRTRFAHFSSSFSSSIVPRSWKASSEIRSGDRTEPHRGQSGEAGVRLNEEEEAGYMSSWHQPRLSPHTRMDSSSRAPISSLSSR